jgi:7-carboxy-7-deazaguanine synthase
MPLLVNEIFLSLQGESTYAGLPCVFVRLTGCNLRCSYCDTPYAYDEGRWVSQGEILDVIGSYGVRLVEITGGEPLLQSECPELASALLGRGYTVLVETNGSQDIRLLPEGCIRIVDLKCPGSGMTDRMDFQNLHRLGRRDEVKFVLQDRRDYEWAREIMRSHPMPEPSRTLLSPAHPFLCARDLAEWMLADRPPARIQVPLHRVLWPEQPRGR